MIHHRASLATCLCLSFLLATAGVSRCEIKAGSYDMAAVRDAATLETRVIENWHPYAKDPSIRQKLVEVTICEWWPGQKVRLPVTFLAPTTGAPCENVVVGNAGLPLKAAAPSGASLRLLKEHRVGLVYIGMGTIDAMEPVGKLHIGMKEHFLKTKDARYTPAWIWGMSDMRALTAAMVEREAFQPEKVLATGGSKRGVATAAAGIADDRFTAILPVVAPIIDSPGGPYVEGMMPEKIARMNTAFLDEIKAGRRADIPTAAFDILTSRQQVRADERISVEQAREAGWSQEEIEQACTRAWEVCRTTNSLPALHKRGVEVFYNQGTNDNVSPGMLKLTAQFPDFPLYIVPGGQHGGAKDSGLLKSVASQPEVDENLYAFAVHHFFGTRPMLATPKVATQWNAEKRTLAVRVTFPDHVEPQKNDVWWSADRHPDCSIEMEYDPWQTMPLQKQGDGSWTAILQLETMPRTLDIVTVHAHTEAGSTLTRSSPLLRVKLGKS